MPMAETLSLSSSLYKRERKRQQHTQHSSWQCFLILTALLGQTAVACDPSIFALRLSP